MPSLNWILSAKGGDTLKGEVINLREKFLQVFPTAIDVDRLDDDGSYTLYRDDETSFEFRVDKTRRENAFDPETFEGAGELVVANGHRSILFICTLVKRVQEINGEASGQLCNESGEVISIKTWSELRSELWRLEFDDVDAFRADAESAGFVEPDLLKGIGGKGVGHYF
jgi:hypothetical protein